MSQNYKQVGSYDMLREAGGGEGVESTDACDTMTHGASCDKLGDFTPYKNGYGWKETLHGLSILAPDGKHIGWATSPADAKKKLDELLNA